MANMTRSNTLRGARDASSVRVDVQAAGVEAVRTLLQNLENPLDLDGGVQRQLRHADRETRVSAVRLEDHGDEIGRAVDHLRQLIEIRGAIDIAAEPHRPHPGEIANRGVRLGQHIQRRETRCRLAPHQRDAMAELALVGRFDHAAGNRQLAGDEQQIADARKTNVIGHRRRRGRQLETQRFKPRERRIRPSVGHA